MSPSPRLVRAASVLSATALLVSACGSSESNDAPAGAGDDHYPVTVTVTVTNCGDEVIFAAEPTNVVMLKSAVVPFLTSIDVLDHVSAEAGAYPDGYFTDDVAGQVESIEPLTDRTDASGHLLISKEAVVEREPDLVLGHTDNLDRKPLEEVSIPSLEASGLCTEDIPGPGFRQIHDEIEMYGQVFNREDEAEEAISELKQRVEEATSSVTKGGAPARPSTPPSGAVPPTPTAMSR